MENPPNYLGTDDEQKMSYLFDLWCDLRLAAGETSRSPFLDRCPASQRAEMADAMDGFDFMRESIEETRGNMPRGIALGKGTEIGTHGTSKPQAD